MTKRTSSVRRGLALALIGASAVAVRAWCRNRNGAPTDPTPPESGPPTNNVSPLPTARSANSTIADAPARGGTAAAAPEPLSSEPTAKWVSPNDDGTAPATHPIKANEKSGIYHVPGGRFYGRTKPERCYATPSDAEADGYRQAKS